MMTWIILIGIFLLVLGLPVLVGALFRLAAPKTDANNIYLGVGLLFAILTEAIGTEKTGMLPMIDSIRESVTSPQLIGVQIIIMVVIKVGLYAAFAALGVRIVDRLIGSQQPAEELQNETR